MTELWSKRVCNTDFETFDFLLRFPQSKAKTLIWTDFRTLAVDCLVAKNKDGLTATINNDDAYLKCYSKLTEIILGASEDLGAQRRTNQYLAKSPHPRSTSGAILKSRGTSQCISHSSMGTLLRISLEFESTIPKPATDLITFLLATRRQAFKDLYAIKKAEILVRARKYDQARMLGALNRGSTKRLMNSSLSFVALPTALESATTPGVIKSDPQAVMELTWHLPQETEARLTTPSILKVRACVEQDPFIWPLASLLNTFRAMLRKGNPRPSLGPDGWEKWCMNLSDNALQLVLDLHNYSVMNSRFPGNISDTHLTYFHKRGVRTDLSNWRGLLISNFLANSPMTWLNYNLSPYTAHLGIIPETQVATQPGIQTRDLMSFLSSLKTWSARSKTPIYLLKRDQIKGFDYLSRDGFYDACEVANWGSMLSKDCVWGIAEPIIVEGVTKQGGSLSPLKSTMTTSLGHNFLDDLASNDPDCITISSAMHRSQDPHLPNDSRTLRFTMAEANNSYIGALSYPALCRYTLQMERFQFVYGWMTSWPKTTVHILNSPDTVPNTLHFPLITNIPGTDPWIQDNLLPRCTSPVKRVQFSSNTG
ncbi:hypothetical protein FPV67DRAFT_1456580 [Lyophyllum atratum]|nr:hypothetical protein FPV67DRAFT_1456580 [Lyophyllum atratum]